MIRNRIMQHPQLYLGLIGFEPDDHARACSWLKSNAQHARENTQSAEQISHPIWMPVDYQEADALLICGAGVEHGWLTQMQFKPALRKAAGTPLGLMLEDIKMPYALSHVEHLKSVGAQINDQPIFDLRQEVSMLKTIQYFENVLRPLRSLYAVAVELTARQSEIDANHTFHLEHNGALDAIVDVPQRRVMLRPSSRPVDISEAAWLRRPRSANFAPAQFLECSFEEIAWVFAQHCPQTKLPARYRSKRIYLKRSPRVRSSLLYPRHAALLERLTQGPVSLEELIQLLPGSAGTLERDLYALYLTRSISTTPQQGADKQGSSFIQDSNLENTGAWMLDRMSRRMNTIADELKPLL